MGVRARGPGRQEGWLQKARVTSVLGAEEQQRGPDLSPNPGQGQAVFTGSTLSDALLYVLPDPLDNSTQSREGEIPYI